MSTEYKLEIQKREVLKKKDIKHLRKEDKIPGIYYSHNSKTSTPFLVNKKDETDDAQVVDTKHLQLQNQLIYNKDIK